MVTWDCKIGEIMSSKKTVIGHFRVVGQKNWGSFSDRGSFP
jgi:hypothetical protein